MSAGVRGSDPEVNKFEQVSSNGHQMSVARGGRDPSSKVPCGGGLYSEVQCIMSNCHMDKQKRLKTLPSCNFVGGR